jgi:hypothetical protein
MCVFELGFALTIQYCAKNEDWRKKFEIQGLKFEIELTEEHAIIKQVCNYSMFL